MLRANFFKRTLMSILDYAEVLSQPLWCKNYFLSKGFLEDKGIAILRQHSVVEKTSKNSFQLELHSFSLVVQGSQPCNTARFPGKGIMLPWNGSLVQCSFIIFFHLQPFQSKEFPR